MCKPVCGVCNLSCRYCYYTAKPRELYPDEKDFRMPPAVLESFVRQYMEAQPRHCDFGWQGGEPLLAGREFFAAAVGLQKQFGRDGQEVANAIQTNGTLLDDAWCEFLAAGKFLVGLSLDGPPQWHDAMRRDPAGGPTFHRAWAGLELLRKHGVEHNVLVTLNSASAPHAGDIYRYFVNRGVRYLQFIPVLERTPDGRPADYSCTPEQFGRFLIDVFHLWAARDVGNVSERFIDNVLHQLLYGQAALCCYAPRCANAFVLECCGDLYACDHFVQRRWRIGNIMERPLAELAADPLVEEFARLKTDLPARCRDCEYLDFCRGGCPKHHMPLYGGPDRVNYFCEGYQAFFREALPELRRLAEYFRRGEQPPKAAPVGRAYMHAQSPRRGESRVQVCTPYEDGRAGRPPGRNDPCPCGSGRKFKNCCGRQH